MHRFVLKLKNLTLGPKNFKIKFIFNIFFNYKLLRWYNFIQKNQKISMH